MTKILLTGATGFLGSHTKAVLERVYRKPNVRSVGSRDHDLLDPQAVERVLSETRPDVVVHFAGYVGGIGANKALPADFYYRNTILTALMFDAAVRFGVRKLIYPMGGCSYPATASVPIAEDQLWAGYPQPESAPYSTAKMMGLVAASSYKQQYGLNASVIIPGNMYGEFDNFDLVAGHVVPAMIRRFYEAKRNGVGEVSLWGSGRPERDFVYAGDVAETIPFFIEKFDEVGPVNISSGVPTPIRELATTVARLVGYTGRTHWDTSKPDGQMLKIFAVERMRQLGLSCPTALSEGLHKTIRWFANQYESGSPNLRLSVPNQRAVA